MPIDFNKMISSEIVDKKTNPIELYGDLDRKTDAGPLRQIQERILIEWYREKRDDKDLIIKLHTGEGKTLIGLLILLSNLNKSHKPCLYICPNKYLVSQVCNEANKFGIPCCCFENTCFPTDFSNGNKILITHVQKLFNGLSVFGTGYKSIMVDSILLDDSHACIDTIKKAFTITIEKDKLQDLYNQIVTLFKDDLTIQGEGRLLDISNGSYETFMTVPYWSWNEKKSEILSLIHAKSNIDSIKYVWPFLRDKIKNYCCYISGTKIEIIPYYIDIDEFGTFSKANHRILMSATTQDDSFFIKGLNFNISAIKNPLVNNTQKWSGEKMILIPSIINENCDKNLVITRFGQKTNYGFGVISIVSSTRNCSQYAYLGANILNSDNIYKEIELLKQGKFSKMIVINNRYDGIDLPDNACRILIIDGLPYFDSLADRYEIMSRPNCEIINKKIAQKVEQGIGRGVRGEKDYCVIIIIDNDLVRFINSNSTRKYFSPQTIKQIEIGEKIANLAQNEQQEEDDSLKEVISLCKQLLKRDEGWKRFYVNEMNKIEIKKEPSVFYERLLKEYEIEKYYYNEEYDKACDYMQKFIDETNLDPMEKGWYLQILARYKYEQNRTESISIQTSAFKNNHYLLKPITGIKYTKLSYINENRLKNIKKYLSKFNNYNDLNIYIQELTMNLSFGVNSNLFEASLNEAGELLGFKCQRPDKEIRKGPDNLWCGTNNHYLLFECKNEVKEDRDSISKYETGQMNNHCAWFETEYGKDTNVDYFMIIPTKELAYEANFIHKTKIIRRGGLKKLKDNIKSFIFEFKELNLQEVSDKAIQQKLDIHHLNENDFISYYSEDFYQASIKK